MDQQKIDSASQNLVDAVSEIFAAEAASNPAVASQLERARSLMKLLHPDPERPEPLEVPGCRHLARALDLGESGPAAAVARAVRTLEATLAWGQNPRYTVENKGADFMDNYGWTDLGLAGSSTMAFGIMLLGPGVTYPPTSYESEGVFLVIGGSPEWKSGDEPWEQVEAGSVICRPFGGSEGKRPGTEPMLALYAWMYR